MKKCEKVVLKNDVSTELTDEQITLLTWFGVSLAISITHLILDIVREKFAKENERAFVVKHYVKCLPQYFNDIDNGTKTFEVRYNDRDYKVGDFLVLREYDKGVYSGRTLTREICYLLDDSDYCKKGYVILGLK